MPELEDPTKEVLEKCIDFIGELSTLPSFRELFDDVDTLMDLPHDVFQGLMKLGSAFGDLADSAEECFETYDDDREESEEFS